MTSPMPASRSLYRRRGREGITARPAPTLPSTSRTDHVRRLTAGRAWNRFHGQHSEKPFLGVFSPNLPTSLSSALDTSDLALASCLE